MVTELSILSHDDGHVHVLNFSVAGDRSHHSMFHLGASCVHLVALHIGLLSWLSWSALHPFLTLYKTTSMKLAVPMANPYAWLLPLFQVTTIISLPSKVMSDRMYKIFWMPRGCPLHWGGMINDLLLMQLNVIEAYLHSWLGMRQSCWKMAKRQVFAMVRCRSRRAPLLLVPN